MKDLKKRLLAFVAVAVFGVSLFCCERSIIESPLGDPDTRLNRFIQNNKSHYDELGIDAIHEVVREYETKNNGTAYFIKVDLSSKLYSSERVMHDQTGQTDGEQFLVPIFNSDGNHLKTLLTSSTIQEDSTINGSLQVLAVNEHLDHAITLEIENGYFVSVTTGGSSERINGHNTTMGCVGSKFESGFENNPVEEVVGCYLDFAVCLVARIVDCATDSTEDESFFGED